MNIRIFILFTTIFFCTKAPVIDLNLESRHKDYCSNLIYLINLAIFQNKVPMALKVTNLLLETFEDPRLISMKTDCDEILNDKKVTYEKLLKLKNNLTSQILKIPDLPHNCSPEHLLTISAQVQIALKSLLNEMGYTITDYLQEMSMQIPVWVEIQNNFLKKPDLQQEELVRRIHTLAEKRGIKLTGIKVEIEKQFGPAYSLGSFIILHAPTYESTSLVSLDALDAIILHELEHIKRNHSFRLFILHELANKKNINLDLMPKFIKLSKLQEKQADLGVCTDLESANKLENYFDKYSFLEKRSFISDPYYHRLVGIGLPGIEALNTLIETSIHTHPSMTRRKEYIQKLIQKENPDRTGL